MVQGKRHVKISFHKQLVFIQRGSTFKASSENFLENHMQSMSQFVKTDLTIKRPISSENICPMTNNNTKLILALQCH